MDSWTAKGIELQLRWWRHLLYVLRRLLQALCSTICPSFSHGQAGNQNIQAKLPIRVDGRDVWRLHHLANVGESSHAWIPFIYPAKTELMTNLDIILFAFSTTESPIPLGNRRQRPFWCIYLHSTSWQTRHEKAWREVPIHRFLCHEG